MTSLRPDWPSETKYRNKDAICGSDPGSDNCEPFSHDPLYETEMLNNIWAEIRFEPSAPVTPPLITADDAPFQMPPRTIPQLALFTEGGAFFQQNMP